VWAFHRLLFFTKPPDVGGDFRKIVIELVITTGEPVYMGLRDHAFVQVDMPDRRRLVAAAVIEMDGNPRWQFSQRSRRTVKRQLIRRRVWPAGLT